MEIVEEEIEIVQLFNLLSSQLVVKTVGKNSYIRTNQWDPSTKANSYETNHSAQLHKVCKALLNGMLAVKDWMSISKQLFVKTKGWTETWPLLGEVLPGVICEGGTGGCQENLQTTDQPR